VAEKTLEGKAVGRGVACVDAMEAVMSAPLYNAFKEPIRNLVDNVEHPFKHTVAKMSSKWSEMGAVVKDAYECIEADWSQFDINRPNEDIEFFCDVLCSSVMCRDIDEQRILEGFNVAMKNGLIHKIFITEGGGVWAFKDGVPSGSLWTSLLDTFLNTLYVHDAMRVSGLSFYTRLYWCGGDDLLILLHSEPSEDSVRGFKAHLNSAFNANIREDSFIRHRGKSYLVTKSQAIFPIGVDLKKGTSKILDQAKWVEFEGKMDIDDSQGKSHRWKYNFKGRPKFLGCYWDTDLFPIKETDKVLQGGLHPEGVHSDVEDYMEWIISALIDNPFNSHLFNHLSHRWIIANHVKEMSGLGFPNRFIYKCMTRKQSKVSDLIPFPEFIPYRRSAMPGYQPVTGIELMWVRQLKDLQTKAIALYMRNERGGFSFDILQRIVAGRSSLNENEWGADVQEFLALYLEHPATASLKSARRFRETGAKDKVNVENEERAYEMCDWIDRELEDPDFNYINYFCKLAGKLSACYNKV